MDGEAAALAALAGKEEKDLMNCSGRTLTTNTSTRATKPNDYFHSGRKHSTGNDGATTTAASVDDLISPTGDPVTTMLESRNTVQKIEVV